MNADAYYLLARSEWARGDLKSALTAFQNVLSLNPARAPALADLAVLLLDGLNNVQSAEKFSRRAIAADPGYAAGYVVLGNVFKTRGDTSAAAECYRRALGCNGHTADPPVNLGVLALEAGDTEGALRWFARGLEIEPDHANGRWNRGNLLLMLGRFAEGWPDYEYRFRITGRNASRPDPLRTGAAWDGREFRGKTLLVWCEQGLGDTIQFVRYLPLVKERGGEVIFECQEGLVPLLRTLPGADQVSTLGVRCGGAPGGLTPSRRCDFSVPLLSLPGIFRTSVETIPGNCPYIFPEPARSAEFAARFDAGKFNVGIAWSGNPRHPSDRNRSCAAADLEILASVPGVRLYSLQKSAPPAASRLGGLEGQVVDCQELLVDFAATAAVVAHLDLLISVDTAVAHLAGAMGKPVWTLVPFVPDWRWQLGREDTPWYPTMRLFRQSVPGDWSGVVARVRGELEREAGKKRASSPVSSPSCSGASDAANLFELGSARFRSGDNAAALRCFRAALGAEPGHVPARNALGVVLAALGDLEAAAGEFAHALADDPENAECHYNLGNVRREQGRLGESAACYRAAIAASPGFLQAHVNLGVVLNEQGDTAGALEEYRSALALDPTSAILLRQFGSLCLKVDDREGALQAFERAIQADPGDADLVQSVGAMHKAAGNLESAIRYYRRVAELLPDSAEAWAQLGTNLFQNGQHSEAYRAFENALRIKPDFPGVLNNMGMVMKEKGQVELAEKCYTMAIRTDPGYAPAYNNLGTLYLDGSRFSEAEAQFREAVRLDPRYLLAWNNLGNALAGQGSYHEAKQIYRLVIAEDPKIPEVHFNLAAALAYENRMAESIRGYDEAVRLRPEYYEARLNKALILLQKGDFEEGWKEYEWRFRVRDPRRAHVPPVPKGTQWDGADVQGKRILVRFEQGFGDTIQFARYIPLLASRGAVVVFECPRELAGLFRNFPGVSRLIEYTGTPPDVEYDAYVQLLSLPRLLGTNSVESIPWSGPYIHPDPDAANIPALRLDRELFNVGVVWGGNPLHTNDHNRTCTLGDFVPLFGIPGARFHSLQKGKPAAQLRTLPEGCVVADLDAELKDFSVTAGILSCLDLVIAVDTSVAHLAGAMGVTAWTLLPFRSDWRWLLDRTDSPWYPGMRLFRQKKHADWPGLVREVKTELELLIANRPGHE